MNMTKNIRRKTICIEKKIDVINIDKQIKSLIEKDYNDLPKYKTRLKELNNKFELEKEYIKKKNIKLEIDKLNLLIHEIDNNTRLPEYIYLSSKIVDEYNTLNMIPVNTNFFKSEITDPNKKRKQQLLDEFCAIAINYVDIVLYTKPQNIDSECCCGNKDNFITNNYCVKCEDCGKETLIYSTTTSYKDIDRVNLSQKYKYKRKVHFRDCVYSFQGKQNKKIPEKVYEDLDAEFIKHSLLNDSNNYYEKHSRISKQHILMFLAETNHNNHYEDINLIYNHLTGKPCPDLSEIEEDLFNDFDLVVDAFSKLENIDRLNFLNSQYVLNQLIRRRNFPISPDEFDLLRTRERLREHDFLYSQICLQLEWTMTNCI